MFRILILLLIPVGAGAEICPAITPAAHAWILETAHATRLENVRALTFTPSSSTAAHEIFLCHLDQLRTLRLDDVTDLARAARLADLPPRLETLSVNAKTVDRLCTKEQGCPLGNLLVKSLILTAPRLKDLPAGALPIGLKHLTLVGDPTRKVELDNTHGLTELLSLKTLNLDGFQTARHVPNAPVFAAR